MEKLKKIIESPFSSLKVSFEDENWNKDVQSKAGWYYFCTSAPYSAFIELSPPPSEYENEEGEMKKCRNYNLSARATSHSAESNKNTIVIAGDGEYAVYSGYAKNLKTRSKEHTFAHPGTAGLALSRYPTLRNYIWCFYFKYIDSDKLQYGNRDIVLKLGEQIWRANNGWPLLCSA